MTVYELVEKLHGEIVRGTDRVRRGSEYIVLGALVNGEMAFTEAGQRLAAIATPEPAVPAAPKRTRRFTPTAITVSDGERE